MDRPLSSWTPPVFSEMTNPRNTPSGDSATTLFSSARLDALREVANIGAGHAATALSTLTATRIMISVPMVNIVPPGDFVPEIARGVEIVAVRMAMSGAIGGQTGFLLAIPTGLRTTGKTEEALKTLGDRAPQAESPILCVETEFFLEEPVESLHGFFLLVPDQKAFDAIFRAVRVE